MIDPQRPCTEADDSVHHDDVLLWSLCQSLADNLSYGLLPKPFKDEQARKQGPRRNKTLKQIIGAERLRGKQVLAAKMIDEEGEFNSLEDSNLGEPVNKKSKKEVTLPVNLDVNYTACTSLFFSFSLRQRKRQWTPTN